MLVRRTLSAAYYAKKISHPFSACPWLGELSVSMQDALKIFSDSSCPIQGLLEMKGMWANRAAAPTGVFRLSLF